ncbi:hypothetical protein TK78_00035 [Streptomyces sp. Tue 6075]|uniref:hypothetical protein n=1 Tax=Streptomyces sp. Tue 6075 TaxID=1661694 RepID=UPI00094A4992|nr:hypothetical protein [Streptomyces sp. Tue 6075]APS17507.1 hypothetical protein TK78_00035 [Streptomyces sp. Tue 6075]
MDSKVAELLLGFNALTPAQRNEFTLVINRYIEGDLITKDRIVRESRRDFGITKVDLGPTAQVCRYCGK